MTESHATHEEAVKKLGALIKDIKFAMLTSIDGGVLRARPMVTQKREFDGTLWFLTSTRTHKVSEIEADPRVCVSYSDVDDNNYVSVSGTAQVVQDRAKIEEMWNPVYKAWFPEGLDDPTICVLRIDVEQAEYWDSPSSAVANIAGFIKAVATGKQAKGGEHEQVNL